MGHLDVTIGALLIGVLITAVGFGITTMQTYFYIGRFPKDSLLVKLIVWSLLFLDTLHVVFTWHMLYYYLIHNYNNPPALVDSVWSFNITVVLTSVITLIVHCFYARRVFVLSGGMWIVTVSILALSVVRIVFGCIVTAKIFEIKDFELLPSKITGIVVVALGSGTVADCIITGTLVYFLRTHKSGFNRLDNFLDKVTYWTVNNGLLTSVVGIVFLITFAAMPDNMIFLAVHLLLSKLYANSLLATLNFRSSYRGRGVETDHTSISMSGVARRAGSSAQFANPKDTQVSTGPVVHIVTTTATDSGYGTGSGFETTDSGKESPYKHVDYDFEVGAPTSDLSPGPKDAVHIAV